MEYMPAGLETAAVCLLQSFVRLLMWPIFLFHAAFSFVLQWSRHHVVYALPEGPSQYRDRGLAPPPSSSWWPDFELLIRRIIDFYNESVLLLYQALLYNGVAYVIRVLHLDKLVHDLDGQLRDVLSRVIGRYTTQEGEAVKFSLFGYLQPCFDAPEEYDPKGFPFCDGAYGQPLDHPANVHLAVNAGRLSFEDTRIIRDVVNNRWGCQFHRSELATFARHVDANGVAKFVPDTFWFSFRTPHAYLVVFRGTNALSLINWESDFDAYMVRVPGMGGVHSGFYNALFDRPRDAPTSVYNAVMTGIAEGCPSGMPIFVIGYSLGAALAAVFAQAVAAKDVDVAERVKGVFTFGEPRVGDDEFVDIFFGFYGAKCVRYVYGTDIVTKVPPRFGYDHHPVERYMTSFFLAKQRVLKGETHEEEIVGWKYFEGRWMFVIGAVKLVSSVCSETRLRTMARAVLGLLPGVNDHMDYEIVIRRYMKSCLQPHNRGTG